MHSSLLFFFFNVLLSCLSAPLYAQKPPPWINPPHSPYNKPNKELAIGIGKSYAEAQTEAYSALARKFGVYLDSQLTSKLSAEEILGRSVISKQLKDTTYLSANQELYAVSIVGNFYNQDEQKYYTLLSMDTKQAGIIMQNKIHENIKTIEDYIVSSKKIDTLRAYALLKKALVHAKANKKYNDQLFILNQAYTIPSTFSEESINLALEKLAAGLDLKLTSSENFPKDVKVAIENAVLSTPFRIRTDSAPYIMELEYSLDVKNIGDKTYLSSFTVIYTFLNSKGVKIFNSELNNKSIGSSEKDARNAVIRETSNKIKKEFVKEIENFLAGL